MGCGTSNTNSDKGAQYVVPNDVTILPEVIKPPLNKGTHLTVYQSSDCRHQTHGLCSWSLPRPPGGPIETLAVASSQLYNTVSLRSVDDMSIIPGIILLYCPNMPPGAGYFMHNCVVFGMNLDIVPCELV